jgi:hypothetical protein
MRVIGLIAIAIFVTAWALGAAAWCYTAYHLLMLNVSWRRANPESYKQIVSGLSIFRPNLPEPAKVHRRKMFIGATVFCGCVAFGFIDGMIGVWFGGWQSFGG